MPEPLILVSVVIAIALIFDFINGFHDAANAIATVVATRVLSPLQAVLLAAFWNFFGVLIFGVAVATTVGTNVIQPELITTTIILSGLIGAIAWDLVTWYIGLPTSSSHALIGGLLGAGLTAYGFEAIKLEGITKIFAFIAIAPILGFIGAIVLAIIVMWIFKPFRLRNVNFIFRKAQLLSASLYSLSHGTNDAQKTMGVIAAVLLANGLIDHFYVPGWVIISAYAAIGLGTLLGGWRIVKTMGMRITKLRPVDGFSAETGGSLVLLGTALAGIPVSTTHVIAGSIMGVGTVRRASAVKWGVARKIFQAWILTIPMSALFAAMAYSVINLFL